MKFLLFFGKTAARPLAHVRRLALLVALLLAPWLRLPVQAQVPTFTYAGACGEGTTTNASVRIAQTVQDAAGNSYVTGDFLDSATFGTITLQGSGDNIFVAKLDAAANVLWAVRVSGARGSGIAVDTGGNAFITGVLTGTATFGAFNLISTATVSYAGNAFVAKLNPSGVFLWAVQSLDRMSHGFGIAVDADGCSYVSGFCSYGPNADAHFGPFQLVSNLHVDNLFVAKLDPTGRFVWVAAGGGSEFATGYGIALDSTGSVYVTGIVVGSPGRIARFGSAVVTTLGEDDVLVAKLSPAGVFQWAVNAGGRVADVGQRIAIDAQGIVHVVGYFLSGRPVFGTTALLNPFAGAVQAFVATLTPTGVWQWAVQGGGPGDDYGYDLSLDAAGNTYVVGSCSYRAAFGGTVLTTAGDKDVFVCKIDPAGAYVWAIQAGGSGDDEATGVTLGANASLTLAGNTRSSLAVFGTQGFAATPASITGFLARLSLGPLATASAQRIPALALWPSPARSGEVIHIKGLTTRQPVEVRDVLGRLVATSLAPVAGAVAIALPAGLGSGVYFVRAGSQLCRFTV